MSRRPDAVHLEPATLSEIDGVRYLHLGTPWVQGAMRIARPQKLELDYIRRMMVWLLLLSPERWAGGHAVQLGLGAGAITRYCHGVLKMRTTAVELNPSVIAVNHAAFRLPREAEGLTIVQMDAADYVADPAHAGSADVLCVDLYDHDAASPVLDSDAFYLQCHRLVAEGGVMTVNLFGRTSSFATSRARIAAAFGEARVASMQATKQGNTVLIAMKGEALPSPETLAERAEAIEAAYRLPATDWLRMLRLPLVAASTAAAAAAAAAAALSNARQRA